MTQPNDNDLTRDVILVLDRDFHVRVAVPSTAVRTLSDRHLDMLWRTLYALAAQVHGPGPRAIDAKMLALMGTRGRVERVVIAEYLRRERFIPPSVWQVLAAHIQLQRIPEAAVDAAYVRTLQVSVEAGHEDDDAEVRAVCDARAAELYAALPPEARRTPEVTTAAQHAANAAWGLVA